MLQLWLQLWLLLGQPLLGDQGCPAWLWHHIWAVPHRDDTGAEPGSCCGAPQLFPEVLGSAGISWSILRPLAGV